MEGCFASWLHTNSKIKLWHPSQLVQDADLSQHCNYVKNRALNQRVRQVLGRVRRFHILPDRKSTFCSMILVIRSVVCTVDDINQYFVMIKHTGLATEWCVEYGLVKAPLLVCCQTEKTPSCGKTSHVIKSVLSPWQLSVFYLVFINIIWE